MELKWLNNHLDRKDNSKKTRCVFGAEAMHDSLCAHRTLRHLFVDEVAVSAATQRTRHPLVALLVAAVAHGEVVVPARARPAAGSTRTAVPAHSAVLSETQSRVRNWIKKFHDNLIYTVFDDATKVNTEEHREYSSQ